MFAVIGRTLRRLRESDLFLEDAALPAGAQPTRVQAGIYLDRIPNSVSAMPRGRRISTSGFGGAVPMLHRAKSFWKISKFFDVRRFPLDNHLLTINIEHPAYRRAELLFVADPASSISSRAQVAAYRIGRA